jgi:hypothetical protein
MDESKRVCPPPPLSLSLSLCVCVCPCVYISFPGHQRRWLDKDLIFRLFLPQRAKLLPTNMASSSLRLWGNFVAYVNLQKLLVLSFFPSILLCWKTCELQSAKTNLNVEEVFFSIARDIKQRLADTDSRTEVQFELWSRKWWKIN